ncbi:response regulator [uncultured Amphritea sp.]|uniref:response regulator n=1 Tax=uncultured Amphritea sp. TaxID=981605 RepID=UPI002613E48B|nr:response regulator [uncultured Amphritea sp.]
MAKSVVLVLNDGGHLHDDAEHFLRRKGYKVVTDPDEFGDAFARDDRKIILIAYQDLLQGVESYSKLVIDFSLEHSPHYRIVLCLSKDIGKASELCLNQTVDNYFIVKPSYDMHRLALVLKQADDAVVHAEQRMALAYIGEELLEHKKVLDRFIYNNVDKGVECQADTVESFSSLLNELTDLIAGQSGRNITIDHQRVAEQTRQLSDRKLKQISDWAETVKEEYNEISRLNIPAAAKDKKNIALIDSNAQNVLPVQQIISDCGYNLIMFKSAKEALPAMICQNPDLVLLDYEISDLSALKVLAYMQKFNQLADIPVILLTGHRDKEIISNCLKAGARDFIIKPADKDVYQEKIDKFFPEKHQG